MCGKTCIKNTNKITCLDLGEGREDIARGIEIQLVNAHGDDGGKLPDPFESSFIAFISVRIPLISSAAAPRGNSASRESTN
jgi:hypothetical protein